MPKVLDIEQSMLLLELEPPFDQRAVQLARRRLAKRWHPDVAPPGRAFEHERHLKAINEAADQLEELTEQSRGGRVSANAVKVSAAAARKRRAEEGRRAYEAEQRARAQAADRVQRFVAAAQHAMAEGDYATAAQRLVYARIAGPGNPAVLRLMTLAFWQAKNFPAAGRAVRDWIRVEGNRPTAHRYAARIYEDMGAFGWAADEAQRAADRAPGDASAWVRLGGLRLRTGDLAAARSAFQRAPLGGPSGGG